MKKSDKTRKSNVVANDVEEGGGCRNSTPLRKHAISDMVHKSIHHEIQKHGKRDVDSAGLLTDDAGAGFLQIIALRSDNVSNGIRLRG